MANEDETILTLEGPLPCTDSCERSVKMHRLNLTLCDFDSLLRAAQERIPSRLTCFFPLSFGLKLRTLPSHHPIVLGIKFPWKDRSVIATRRPPHPWEKVLRGRSWASMVGRKALLSKGHLGSEELVVWGSPIRDRCRKLAVSHKEERRMWPRFRQYLGTCQLHVVQVTASDYRKQVWKQASPGDRSQTAGSF